MRILFSPIGMTDPISDRNLQEGSLLQICRFYQPDMIYLHMSQTVVELHEKDNRYLACLDRLYEKMRKTYTYELILDRDLVEVQEYDPFYKKYQEVLVDIHQAYPQAEILLNVSSGTPAMKQALYVLCNFFNFPTLPIQVATPTKQYNGNTDRMISQENPLEAFLDSIDLIMEEPELYENRTTVATNENLNFELKKDLLKKHLDKYNYPAALEVVEGIRDLLPDRAYHLVAAAFYRNKLDNHQAEKHLRAVEEKFDYYATAQKRLVEYLLYLGVLIKRDMLLEFIRGLTPVLDILFRLAFEKESGICLDPYLIEREGQVKWSQKALVGDEIGQRIMTVLDSSYGGNYSYKNSASSDNFLKLLESEVFGRGEGRICKEAQTLREVEKKGRNKAAHQIISIDDAFLKKTTGYESQVIFKKLTDLVHDLNLGVKREHWQSYEKMNEKIISSLEESSP